MYFYSYWLKNMIWFVELEKMQQGSWDANKKIRMPFTPMTGYSKNWQVHFYYQIYLNPCHAEYFIYHTPPQLLFC